MVEMKSGKRNILLVVVDCLREDHVHFSADENRAHIPTISRLKDEGFSFRNTISSSCTTVPSFSSILTGRYPFENGLRNLYEFTLRDEVNTLPEHLKEHGYNTYAEVTGPMVSSFGLNRGFDEYNYRDVKNTIHTEWGTGLLDRFENHYKEPWFVLLHIWTLHYPRIVHRDHRGRRFGSSPYGRALSGVDAFLSRLIGSLGDDTIIIVSGDHGEHIGNSRFQEVLRGMRLYFFRRAKKWGLVKKPFAHIIRKAPIGHGYDLTDTLVRVPLIFHGKGVVQKGSSTVQVRQIDIAPTILELAGGSDGMNVRGESLACIMNGDVGRHRDAYMEAVGILIPCREDWLNGIRIKNRYKLINSQYGDWIEDLFLLRSDRDEIIDLSGGHRDLVRDMKTKIDRLMDDSVEGKNMNDRDEENILKVLGKLGYV